MKALIKAQKTERLAKTEYRALTERDLPQIVKRYLAGEYVDVLAKEAGKPQRVIYEWMLSGVGEEKYKELVTKALIGRIADADAKLADAKDMMSVSKHREMARYARMDFERRRPTLYGAKQDLATMVVAPVLNITIVEPQGQARIVEGEVRAIEEQKAG